MARETVLFASAARTTNENSNEQVNSPSQFRYKGVRLFLDITAVTGTNPTLDVKLQAKDPASDKWFDVTGAAFAQQTGTGTALLTLYPGIKETANDEVSEILPDTWRIATTIGGTDTPTFTFSLGAEWL